MPTGDWRNDPNAQEWAQCLARHNHAVVQPTVVYRWDEMVRAVREGAVVHHVSGVLHSLIFYKDEEVLVGESNWGGRLYLRRRDVERTG